jgi:hypothetical protein
LNPTITTRPAAAAASTIDVRRVQIVACRDQHGVDVGVVERRRRCGLDRRNAVAVRIIRQPQPRAAYQEVD